MNVVVDASAVIALLLEEPGAEIVESAIESALISTVNVAEVAARLIVLYPAEVAQDIMNALALLSLAPDEATAFDAGLLRSITAIAGLSLGDRFCLALARRLNLPVLTADRAWIKIASAVGVEVRLIR